MYLKIISSLLLLVAFLHLISCTKEDNLENQELIEAKEPVALDKLELTEEVLNTFRTHSFNTDFIEIVSETTPEGDTYDVFLLEGDIVFTKEDYEDLLTQQTPKKQYRTRALVNTPKTIKVLARTGGRWGLDSRERQALRMAARNFNNLNLKIKFTVSFARTNLPGNDIYVVRDPNVTTNGGRAGFPSNGRPYNRITIYGMRNGDYSLDRLEHVMAHELGHCVGLRHSDYRTRESCGSGGYNEGDAGVGARHLPGTPTGYVRTSIMNACTYPATTGEFNGGDKRALRLMYQ